MTITDNAYKNLSHAERVILYTNAIARGDKADADRIMQTCERVRLIGYSPAFTNKVDELELIAIHFELEGRLLMGGYLAAVHANRADAQERILDKLTVLGTIWMRFCEEIGLDAEAALNYFTFKESVWYGKFDCIPPEEIDSRVDAQMAELRKGWNRTKATH